MIDTAIVEATIIRLVPGDILLVRLEDGALHKPVHVIEEIRDAFQSALDAAGHKDDVGVLLTADGIGLTIIRPEPEEPA